MNIKQIILQELRHETQSTRRIIEAIDEQHLNYKPHEKSMTLLELAGHIVLLHSWVGQGLSKTELDLKIDGRKALPSSKEQLLEVLAEAEKQGEALVEAFSPEQWEQGWTMRVGDYVLQDTSRYMALRQIILNHLIHHRGQLSVYLRLLDLPVPGLYGPSADEQMPAF